MGLDLLILIAGLTALLGGGDLLVRGAAALAERLGVSPLVIGLTVVAFGTSAPELSVNMLAAFQGNSDISFGNIIGSNIANIGLIIGISALFKPLTITSTVITREIPMMVLASLLAIILGMDTLFRSQPNSFDRSDGLVFLLIFGVFLYYTIAEVLQKKKQDAFLQQAEEKVRAAPPQQLILNLCFVIAGLVCLIYGGKYTVNAAVSIAESFNIPKVIIGLTIIAVGTSLPELATSIIATYRGQTDIAVGNVVGSNIFNLLLVNGTCAAIQPIPIPESGGLADLGMATLLAVVLLPLCITHNKRIVRWEGAILLVMYAAYSIWRLTG